MEPPGYHCTLTTTFRCTAVASAFDRSASQLFAILIALFLVSCRNDNSSEQATTGSATDEAAESDDLKHLAATRLVSTLILSPSDKDRFKRKLAREMGEETGGAFFGAVHTEGYREALTNMYSHSFNHHELIKLTSVAEDSRIVRLSLLTAPHTLSDIPGMGSGRSPTEEWERLRTEVEFFGITSIEEFKEESKALRFWDTYSFLSKFEELRNPMEDIINKHLADQQ